MRNYSQVTRIDNTFVKMYDFYSSEYKILNTISYFYILINKQMNRAMTKKRTHTRMIIKGFSTLSCRIKKTR